MLRIEDPLYETIYPEFVRLTKLNALHELKAIVLYSIKKLMKYIVPVLVIVLIFANIIIKVIFGIEYVEAVNAFRVISVAGFISLSIFWINPVLLSFERPGIRNILDVTTMISFIGFLAFLVPDYSYTGAAFAFLGSVIVRLFVSLYVLKFTVETEKR